MTKKETVVFQSLLCQICVKVLFFTFTALLSIQTVYHFSSFRRIFQHIQQAERVVDFVARDVSANIQVVVNFILPSLSSL